MVSPSRRSAGPAGCRGSRIRSTVFERSWTGGTSCWCSTARVSSRKLDPLAQELENLVLADLGQVCGVSSNVVASSRPAAGVEAW